jgi:3-hydroxyacyl-CoA dehydrogenase
MMSSRAMPDPQVDELVRKWVQEAGITQRQIAAPEIMDRCIYALRASDIDIIYLNGYGFPAHRGGPMWYADTGGLKQVLRASPRIPSPARRNLEARPATIADFGKEEGVAA